MLINAGDDIIINGVQKEERSLRAQTKVGEITQKVIDTFGLSVTAGTSILCGPDNIIHMQTKHPSDFAKYNDKLNEIISSPDYICKHPNKSSIEYVKVFKNDKDEHVLVVVRASGNGVMFARTLFVMDPKKVQSYQAKDAFKPY